jgi:hypothetical protein
MLLLLAFFALQLLVFLAFCTVQPPLALVSPSAAAMAVLVLELT